MQRLFPGDFLPHFITESSINPRFVFNSLAGRQFLLAFIGTVRSEVGRALSEALLAEASWLAERRILVYVVTADSSGLDDPVLSKLTKRFAVFWDRDRTIAGLCGMEATPAGGNGTAILRLGVFVVRENLRMHAMLPPTPIDGFRERLRAAAETLPRPEPERAIAAQAPVLLVPDVLNAAECRRFVEYYDANGGSESGFMRDIDGKTTGILDPKHKRRKDLYINDPELKEQLRSALVNRVLPEIRKAYAYHATRLERYMIGCYDDSDQGFFSAHRDNESKATSHRAFAVSLNLNSDEYEGGSLRFPEYSRHTYKPATGSAVVFSCSLLHEALPVTRGRRLVILPFLYDDAAASRRAENLKFLQEGPPTRIEERIRA